MAYDFGFGSARRSKIESGPTPSGALCEKPKEASSTRTQIGSGPLAPKQLGPGPLAFALIRAARTLVGSAQSWLYGYGGRGAQLGGGARAHASSHVIVGRLQTAHGTRVRHRRDARPEAGRVRCMRHARARLRALCWRLAGLSFVRVRVMSLLRGLEGGRREVSVGAACLRGRLRSRVRLGCQ